MNSSGQRTLPAPISPPGEAPGFDPRDVAAYYSFPRQFDGIGTTIALVSLYGGYRRSDLEVYFSSIGLAVPAIDNISVGGAGNNPIADSRANFELVRDIEILGSIAPGARLAVYFAPNNELGAVDGLKAAATDDGNTSVICATWGVDERDVDGAVAQRVGHVVQAAILRGRVVCALGAQWEGGALRPQFPGANPYILACVPTSASPVSGGLLEQPVVAGAAPAESILWPVPPWQATLPAHGEVGGRLVPDVSALSDDGIGYRCYVNGEWASFAGPGAAASIWAGLLACLHQALGRPWGMLSDLYRTLGPSGALAPVGAEGSASVPAWSTQVGWGSPNGERLLATLQRT